MTDSTLSPERRRALERVQVPGALMIVAGTLNLLVAGFLLTRTLTLTDEDRKAIAQTASESIAQRNPGAGMDLREVEELVGVVSHVVAGDMALAIVFALVAVVGGVRMRQLRSRGVALTGAAMLALPCLSPLGCCLVGQAIGTWCLVVLFSEEVADGFAQAGAGLTS